MKAGWLEAREETRLQRALRLPLSPLGVAYGLGARIHRGSYRHGILSPRELSCRVVSVGNLVVGGSGKTPLAAWIARSLRERGHRVALASRGYGRRAREAVSVVSDGGSLRCAPELAGDEPLVLAAHAPGVPVLVGADRGLVGLRAISAFGAEVLVLDDGFQHHRLKSDVQLVTFDGGFGLGNGRLLPRGPLREPASALASADALFVIDGPMPKADAATLERYAPRRPCFAARRRAVGLRELEGGPVAPTGPLSGMEVGVLAGLARASGFRRTLEELGARVVAERQFPDHHRYQSRDLLGLYEETPIWVTTEKDAVKVLPSWRRGADIRVLQIELEVEEPGRMLDWLEASLRF